MMREYHVRFCEGLGAATSPGYSTGRDPIKKSGFSPRAYPSALDGYIDGLTFYRAHFVPNLRDPHGLWGDGTGGTGDGMDGHSDFPNLPDPDNPDEDVFDWTVEDHGDSSPFNPISTWRHFRDLEDALNDAARAISLCDVDKFQRHMHQAQDFYSHYFAGYRWYTGGHWTHDPDNSDLHRPQYEAAAQTTREQVANWVKCCCKINGSWKPKQGRPSDCEFKWPEFEPRHPGEQEEDRIPGPPIQDPGGRIDEWDRRVRF